jgi:flagellar motor switch protein FliN
MEEIGRFADVPLELEIRLDRCSLPLRRILDLSVGSVIATTKPAGENVEVLAGGARIGHGEIVAMDPRMAVRITRLEGGD